MLEHDRLPSFEVAVLPHLDAAYNLARWLTRNQRDAEDVAQEAYLLQVCSHFRDCAGKPRASLLFGHELIGPECLMKGKGG